jgi:chemotaxis signal transduction protein
LHIFALIRKQWQEYDLKKKTNMKNMKSGNDYIGILVFQQPLAGFVVTSVASSKQSNKQAI